MDNKGLNFRNYILKKNNIPVFYTYYNNIDQIKYTFIHNNKFVNYDIKNIKYPRDNLRPDIISGSNFFCKT